jgi:hypothetical protein
MRTPTLCDYPLLIGEILARRQRRMARQKARALRRRRHDWYRRWWGCLLGRSQHAKRTSCTP